MKLTVVLPALLSALRLVLGPVHDTRLITEGQLVFSTEAFTSSHWVRLISERVGVAGNLECDRSAEPPFPCKTQVVFSSERLPSLEIAGDAYSFASADLNLDGREELLVLSAEHGNWRLVNVFALSLDGTYWYRPFDAFLWYPGFEEEVCDASIYWIEASHQIKIVTTNADDETFACSAEMIVDWERK